MFIVLIVKNVYSCHMEPTKFGKSFFESTRGRVVILLRRGVGTVDELARALELTDNAVRLHLNTLERDGLVERRGSRPGARKPHFAYALTHEAEMLFPKAYSTLFNQLISVLKERLSSDELLSVLSEVGSSLSPQASAELHTGSIEERAKQALATLEALGGAPELSANDGKVVVRSLNSCPFSESTSQHPEVCHLAEVLLTEVTGLQIFERCQKGPRPRCEFEVTAKEA